MLREIVAHSARIRTVRFSPDGTQLLSASDDGSARIWLTRDKDVLALARRRVRPLTDEQNERLRQYLGR
jgi:WD40 repeat protein